MVPVCFFFFCQPFRGKRVFPSYFTLCGHYALFNPLFLLLVFAVHLIIQIVLCIDTLSAVEFGSDFISLFFYIYFSTVSSLVWGSMNHAPIVFMVVLILATRGNGMYKELWYETSWKPVTQQEILLQWNSFFVYLSVTEVRVQGKAKGLSQGPNNLGLKLPTFQ